MHNQTSMPQTVHKETTPVSISEFISWLNSPVKSSKILHLVDLKSLHSRA